MLHFQLTGSVCRSPLVLIGRKEMRLPEVTCTETKQGTSTLRAVSISSLVDLSSALRTFLRVGVRQVGTPHLSKVGATISGRVRRKAIA